MSQTIYFQKLKCCTEQFVKKEKYDAIPQKIKALLETHDKVTDKIIQQYFESVRTESKSLVINPYQPKIEEFLKGDSNLLLYDRFYFVNTAMWRSVETEIYSCLQENINSKTEALNIAKDFAVLETLYKNKLLAFEVS